MNNKMLVFCGSFDPFHNGHLAIINHFKEPVFIIPTYNPFKKDYLLNLEERIKTIKLIDFQNKSTVLDFTKENPDYYSFMCNIITKLNNDFPNKELIFIMGDDTYLSMHKWKNYNDIKTHINCIVFNRDYNYEINESNINTEIKTELLPTFVTNTSSSLIRQGIKNNNYSLLKENCPLVVQNEIYKIIEKRISQT